MSNENQRPRSEYDLPSNHEFIEAIWWNIFPDIELTLGTKKEKYITINGEHISATIEYAKIDGENYLTVMLRNGQYWRIAETYSTKPIKFGRIADSGKVDTGLDPHCNLWITRKYKELDIFRALANPRGGEILQKDAIDEAEEPRKAAIEQIAKVLGKGWLWGKSE